jgi:hypothetical protein
MLRACLPVLVALLVACESDIDGGDAPPAQIELNVLPASRQCVHCGWIESKREIVAHAVDPLAMGVYEYTLRMSDRSSSVFRETLPARWRLGERVGVIVGAPESPGTREPLE